MALFQIKSRWGGSVLFQLECGSLRLCVEAAVKARANLAGANLAGANLADANLARANLARAYLAGANLADAFLAGANLADANLARAFLAGANLAGANLAGANLADANLAGANLADANLADANLAGANLAGANLARAFLADAKDIPAIALARTTLLPEGALIGWKKLSGGLIAQLRIPDDAKRSSAAGRKCRASEAFVMAIYKGETLVKEGRSQHDASFVYRMGATVKPHEWCEDRWQECAGGIHFYITRTEAEEH